MKLSKILSANYPIFSNINYSKNALAFCLMIIKNINQISFFFRFGYLVKDILNPVPAGKHLQQVAPADLNPIPPSA